MYVEIADQKPPFQNPRSTPENIGNSFTDNEA